jgi:hypothetical protein
VGAGGLWRVGMIARKSCATIGFGKRAAHQESPMRKLTTLLFVLLAAGISPAQGVLKQFDDDPAKKRFVKEGMKLLDDYFKADMEMAKARQRNPAAWADKQRKARDGFLAWLERSKETLGVDLRTDTDTVLDLLDNARVKYLTTKVKKAKLDYITIADPKGMERHEYTVLLPKTYSPKGPRLPLIISLHGRVINPKHPALKKDFTQRSRQVVYNNWLKSSVAGKAIIVAPTTRPNGFTFDGDDTFRDLQTLYRTLGQAMINYRVDWNRVFLEVEGGAMRATCEQTFMFAGFIVRDRVDNRRRPFIDPSEFFMFENLNGIPLCYIADKANWAKVGQPIATALEAAYKKADATGNLLVLQADRDVNDALGAADIQLLEFVGKHKRVKVRKSFNWRFFRQLMVNPMPFELNANLFFDVNQKALEAPLEKKAGSMNVEVSQKKVKDKDGKVRLADGWINFDLPVTVKVNGKVIIDRQVVERDWRSFWDTIVPKRFFMAPYLGSLEAKFEHVPEFVVKKKKPKKKKKKKKKKDDDEASGIKSPEDD